MTQDDALQSLKDAYDAANDAMRAAQDTGASPQTVGRLNDAANFALRCLVQAMQEELTVNNQITQTTKTELDSATSDLKTALKNATAIGTLLTDVDQLVKLAGTLASAFA